MNSKPYLLISATIFGVIAVLHLLRVLYATSLIVGGVTLPVALSWGGLVLTGSLSVWGFRLATRAGR